MQVTETAKQNPLQVTAASTEQVQAVIAFGARYYSGGPFQDPVKVLLKVLTSRSSSVVTIFWPEVFPAKLTSNVR